MDTQRIAEAVETAMEAVGAFGPTEAPEAPQRASQRVYVAPAPKPVSDPRFKAYGEQLLAACRSDAKPVDAQSFWAWRQTQPNLDGHGIATQLRYYRQHRAALDAVAAL